MVKSIWLQVCDDIRREENGKISLMGIFPANQIRLLGGEGADPALPVRLARLGFYGVIRVDAPIKGATIELLPPGGGTPMKLADAVPLAPDLANIIVVIRSPFDVAVIGEYRYVVKTRGGKEILSAPMEIEMGTETRPRTPGKKQRRKSTAGQVTRKKPSSPA